MRMTFGTLVTGALIVFFSVVFVVVAMPVLVFHPQPSDIAEPYTPQQLAGRSVYMANGCFYCHSQYIRPQDWNQPGVTDSGGRVAQAGDYAYQQTVMLGQHRNGPDLSQEGGIHPDDWHYAHFYNPRFTSPKSIMPSFAFMFDANGNPSQQMRDLVAYIQSLGGKLADQRYQEQVAQKQIFLDALKHGGMFGDANQKALLAVVPQNFWTLLDPVPPDERSLVHGKTIFLTNCIGCHGVRGDGGGPAGEFLNPFAYDFTNAKNMQSGLSTSPGSLYEHILVGIKGTAMMPFGQDLSVQDIWDVVNFLYTIPNGGLEKDPPTPDMFIQWQAPPELLQLLKSQKVMAAPGSDSYYVRMDFDNNRRNLIAELELV
jgi:cytochrome c oxidase cbb3-type subunit 2